MPKTDTREKIFNFIAANEPVTAKTISEYFSISSVMAHRHLKKLLQDKKVEKRGTPPKVFYFRKRASIELISGEELAFEDFATPLPHGEIITGKKAFFHWCRERRLDPEKEAGIYQKIKKKYDQYYHQPYSAGLIDATDRLKKNLPDCVLEKVFYEAFYAVEKYGKTKLGLMVLHGKQSGTPALVSQVAHQVSPALLKFLQHGKHYGHQIEAIGLIPHSIKRRVNFLPTVMKETAIFNQSHFESIQLEKIFVKEPIAQKSLKTTQERVLNAQETIFPLNVKRTYQDVLLIDDACGSGATLNETAKKLLDKKIAKRVFGYAFVGSFKGFEVISEI